MNVAADDQALPEGSAPPWIEVTRENLEGHFADERAKLEQARVDAHCERVLIEVALFRENAARLRDAVPPIPEAVVAWWHSQAAARRLVAHAAIDAKYEALAAEQELGFILIARRLDDVAVH